MIPGGRRYSLKRSTHSEPISLCASRIAPLIFPACEKSASLPVPISITAASFPSLGVAGPQASETARNCALFSVGDKMVSRVAPSFQVTGSVYFSVCTSTPAARNPARPHCTALAISEVPVTRPPISSVSRRRFSIIGESPRISGISLAAACAHDDASVAAHASALCEGCNLLSASVLDGASCATEQDTSTETMNSDSITDRSSIKPPNTTTKRRNYNCLTALAAAAGILLCGLWAPGVKKHIHDWRRDL